MIKIKSKYLNKILLLLILISIIYFLCKEKINEFIKNLLMPYIESKEKEVIDQIQKSDDKASIVEIDYHSENLNSFEAEKLYKFLKTLVNPNADNTLSGDYSNKEKVSTPNKEILLKFLNQKLNSNINDMKIKNINFIDKIYLHKNKTAIEILPFQISGNYYLKEKFKGKVKIQLEMIFKFDKTNSIFMSQTIFNNFLGFFNINRVTLTGHNFNETQKTKKTLPSKIEQLEESSEKKEESNFLFNYEKNNHQKENLLDTINSLIPEDIEITEYEEDSDLPISTQKLAF